VDDIYDHLEDELRGAWYEWKSKWNKKTF
jgi:hypothetical protein